MIFEVILDTLIHFTLIMILFVAVFWVSLKIIRHQDKVIIGVDVNDEYDSDVIIFDDEKPKIVKKSYAVEHGYDYVTIQNYVEAVDNQRRLKEYERMCKEKPYTWEDAEKGVKEAINGTKGGKK